MQYGKYLSSKSWDSALDYSTNQSIKQSIIQLMHQSNNQSNNQWAWLDWAIKQSIDWTARYRTLSLTGLYGRQPAPSSQGAFASDPGAFFEKTHAMTSWRTFHRVESWTGQFRWPRPATSACTEPRQSSGADNPPGWIRAPYQPRICFVFCWEKKIQKVRSYCKYNWIPCAELTHKNPLTPATLTGESKRCKLPVASTAQRRTAEIPLPLWWPSFSISTRCGLSTRIRRGPRPNWRSSAANMGQCMIFQSINQSINRSLNKPIPG